MFQNNNKGCRIVLTGGPGGGKTTAADLFRRELGDRVLLVPEAATLLFSGGFPRYDDPPSVKAVQRAIFNVQRGLEDVQAAHDPGKILLCDRGTVDGAAYWPNHSADPHEFFESVNTTLDKELARYDAVIFFETAAVGDLDIKSGNPTRIETSREAVEIDRRLHRLWSGHKSFTFVPHNQSFFKKISYGLVALESIVAQLTRRMATGEFDAVTTPEGAGGEAIEHAGESKVQDTQDDASTTGQSEIAEG